MQSGDDRITKSNLRLLLSGQFTAIVASRIFDVVLIWYALDTTESYASVGLLIFFRYIPYTLFGLVCGWLSDRFDRRRLIVIADFFRAGLMAGAAIALTIGVAPILVLAVSAFFLTVARTLFQPALQGLLPQIAQGARLTQANAVLHGGNEAVGVIAPVIGGTLLTFLAPSILLAVLAAIFAIAAILAAKVRSGPTAKSVQANHASLLRDYQALGRELIGTQRAIFIALLTNAWAILGVSGVLSLLIPILVKDQLLGGPAMLGWLWGIMALGTVAGAFVTPRISMQRREAGMYLAWIVYGALLAIIALSESIVWVFIISFVLGIFGAIADVLFATMVQEEMPSSHVSKTFAGFSTLANTGEAISAPALGLLAGTLGLASAFALGGIIPMVAAALGLVLLGRRRVTSFASQKER